MKRTSRSQVSLHGRTFVSTSNPRGDITGETVFHFQEDGSVVHARYQGGPVLLGFLVGVRALHQITFRYVQLTTEGLTSSGISTDNIEVLRDGRIRLNESWKWESREGAGTSVLEEIKVDERGARRGVHRPSRERP